MKYIITGSLGHISHPLTQKLISAGHEVTVITSNSSRSPEITALGAKPAVGSVEDKEFLANAFAGADAVYLMIPPNNNAPDWYTYQKSVGDNYVAAIEANKTKHVVVLSSIGAHMGHGAGPVDGAAYLEQQSARLTETNILYLRPSYFYINLYSMIPMIKHAGIMGSTQPADFKIVLVHPADIAEAAAKALLALSFKGHSHQYIASEDSLSWSQITKAIGAAIGKPELPYVEFTDEQSQAGMLQAGLSETIAQGFVAMGKALRDGDMQADYWNNRPALGKVKLADFIKEFEAAYKAA